MDPVAIANGYDDALFRIKETPRDLGLLFVGTLAPVKNLLALLRAYAASPTARPPTSPSSGWRAEASPGVTRDHLGIGDRMSFLGPLDHASVAVLMQRASVLVLPSLSEGWPLVIGEALSCGTPVVASRVGGSSEIVAADDGGILFEPGDENGLAAALIAILERQHDPFRTAAASHARPWSVQAERIAAVYGGALASRGPTSALAP